MRELLSEFRNDSRSDVKIKRGFNSVLVSNQYFLSLGGYTRLQGGRWSDSRALSCVERFDSFSQYWTTVSSLHQARSGLGVAVLEGMIYVVGG